MGTALFALVLTVLVYAHTRESIRIHAIHAINRAYAFDWRATVSFPVTHPMRVSVALSLVLGVFLGSAVGILSGVEPAVIIGVSASMSLGCVFVMLFAIVHGVNVLRATAFALLVSSCLPIGFGFGFGLGVLIAVFLGLEHPDDVRDKASHFVTHIFDFTRVVLLFTFKII